MHLYTYATWLKINVIFFGGWVTTKNGKSDGKQPNKHREA